MKFDKKPSVFLKNKQRFFKTGNSVAKTTSQSKKFFYADI